MSESKTDGQLDGIGRAWLRVSISDNERRIAEIDAERKAYMEDLLRRLENRERNAASESK